MAVDFSTIPQISYVEASHIRDRADAVRAEHWGEGLPVNVDLIAEKGFDISFTPIPGLRHYVSTEAYLTSSLKEIIYDETANGPRLRFSIAHELGHRILHPDQIVALRRGSFTEWKRMLNEMPPKLWGRAEWQARQFAGRLLIPRQKLIEAVLSMRDLIAEAVSGIDGLEVPALNEYLAPHISVRFAVSGIVVKTQLRDEGIDPIQLIQNGRR